MKHRPKSGCLVHCGAGVVTVMSHFEGKIRSYRLQCLDGDEAAQPLFDRSRDCESNVVKSGVSLHVQLFRGELCLKIH